VKGFSLAEVLIATMVVGLMAMGAFSVALTGRTGSGKTARRTAAALDVQRVAENLKNFTTPDVLVAPGPGAGWPNGWALPGDLCYCYAFQTGLHRLDAAQWLPEFSGPPYNGSISYTVVNDPTPDGARPTVNFKVDWTEP